MKASIKNYRQSPRKVRLVADAVRGKKVSTAITTLQFMPKRAARAVKTLIASAAANAAQAENVTTENLTISKITVDDGITMKRSMPRSRGMANPIRKRTSNIIVELGTKEVAK